MVTLQGESQADHKAVNRPPFFVSKYTLAGKMWSAGILDDSMVLNFFDIFSESFNLIFDNGSFCSYLDCPTDAQFGDLWVWKCDGSILYLSNAVSQRYSYYGGWRNMKLLNSGEMRRVLDACIFAINGMVVFL